LRPPPHRPPHRLGVHMTNGHPEFIPPTYLADTGTRLQNAPPRRLGI
jgi:hypothetical protein